MSYVNYNKIPSNLFFKLFDNLNISKPVCSFDLETTGTDRNICKIISIGITKVFPNKELQNYYQEFNPGVPIPPEVSQIIKLTDKDVKNKLPFKNYVDEIYNYLKDTYIIGYNCIYFDIPVLVREFEEAGSKLEIFNILKNVIDVNNLWKLLEKRDLESAVKKFCPDYEFLSHNSKDDAQATLFVLNSILNLYKDKLPSTFEELSYFSCYNSKIVDPFNYFILNKDQNFVFNFGKYKNELAHEHIDFLYWMIRSNFPRITKNICEYIIWIHNKQSISND